MTAFRGTEKDTRFIDSLDKELQQQKKYFVLNISNWEYRDIVNRRDSQVMGEIWCEGGQWFILGASRVFKKTYSAVSWNI